MSELKTGVESEIDNGHEHNTSLLRISDLTKKFPGTVALNKFDLEVRAGQIHALVGENGAGKSTLCNVVTGIYSHHEYEGDVFFGGKRVQYTHPSQALHDGITMVYQERNLISFLTGAQNIFLGVEPGKYNFVSERTMASEAQRLLDNFQVNVPLSVPVFLLSPSERQMVEIMRALRSRPKLLILDEPTSSLVSSDVHRLFAVLRRIREEGTSVIFISHKLDEVFEICDTISVIRDGSHIITRPKDQITQDECIKHMVNRDIVDIFPPFHASATEKLLQVNSINGQPGFIENINLQVSKGEIVGLYGLAGGGCTEICEIIAGLRKTEVDSNAEHGIFFLEKDITQRNLVERTRRGIFFVPDDRHAKGLFFNFNLRENVTILLLDRLMDMLGVLRKERAFADGILNSELLDIDYVDMNEDIDSLSGGNKQKIVLSRWINSETINDIKLLIANNVTEGIDVGVKYEIYKLLRELVEKRGMGIIFVSSEMREEMGLCDRIYCVKRGTITGEVARRDFGTGETILRHVL